MIQPEEKLGGGDQKLNQRCKTLAVVVLRLRPLHQRSTKTQKALLETMIGAAIWYFPKVKNLFSGKMSVEALGVCCRDRAQLRKMTHEHFYPRKRAGADLLEGTKPVTEESIRRGYRAKWVRYHLVTKAENLRLVPFARKGLCERDCYRLAKVPIMNAPAWAYPACDRPKLQRASQSGRRVPGIGYFRHHER